MDNIAQRIYCGLIAVACILITVWRVSQHYRHVVYESFHIEQVGDYYAIKYSHLQPAGKPLFQGKIPGNETCWTYARSVEEPLTPRYRPRTSVPEIGAHAPRAYWRWPGQITKEAFDKAAAVEMPGCMHCVDIVHYKVVKGRLYVGKRARPHMHREVAEEMLKVVLYLFPIPDMEILLHYGDGCTTGLPAISWNVCRQFRDAGFTMPTYSVWRRSLGPKQQRALHSCFRKRYPPDKRKPLAVWRGSTTDTKQYDFNKDNWMQALRIQLHQFGRNHTDVLDTRISSLLNCDDFVWDQLRDTLGQSLGIEDFNRYCAIVDVDGNGWSDRFGQLVQFNTPIIKIESNHTAFFEHLYAPDVAIVQFRRDFADLPDKAREIIAGCMQQGSNSRGQHIAASMQANSKLLMDHVGLAEGFAYTLMVYHALSDWVVDGSPAALSDFNEVNMTCCTYANVPRKFARLVSARLDGKPLGRNPV